MQAGTFTDLSLKLIHSQHELRYAFLIMVTRDELKSLIEKMPEGKLDLVRMNLDNILRPPAPNPMIEKMMRRSEEFRKQLPERLKQLQAILQIRSGDSAGAEASEAFLEREMANMPILGKRAMPTLSTG